MVNSYVFCSTATGLSGRTALGAKKKVWQVVTSIAPSPLLQNADKNLFESGMRGLK